MKPPQHSLYLRMVSIVIGHFCLYSPQFRLILIPSSLPVHILSLPFNYLFPWDRVKTISFKYKEICFFLLVCSSHCFLYGHRNAI